MPLNDAEDIRKRLDSQLDLIIDGGSCPAEPTTVLGIDDDGVTLIRKGGGDTDFME